MMFDELTHGGVTHLGVCLVWGLAVFLAIVLAERIGQGHFNPAVTIASAIKLNIEPGELLQRTAAQFVGAAAASGVLRLIFPSVNTLGETLPGLPVEWVFLIEVIISFGLMAVIEISLAKKFKLRVAAAVIGGYVFLAAFFAGPYTGASMNPARTLGPAAISHLAPALWVYMIAPVVGMIAAVSIFRRPLIPE
jgi:glycerol uptake facilitator-like aquaporin